MATHRIPILGFATRPDDTGEAFFEAADKNFGSNNLAKEFVLGLGSALAAQPTVKHGVYGAFRIPKNWVSTSKVIVEWGSTVTSGDVVYQFNYNSVGGDQTESFDPAAWQNSPTVTDTASGTARRKSVATITLTDGDLAVDDITQFYFARDGTAAGDTMAGRAYVFELTFEYADV